MAGVKYHPCKTRRRQPIWEQEDEIMGREAKKLIDAYLAETGNTSTLEAWETLPRGWTQASLRSFWDSLTGDVEHKITQCMERMEGKVSDTGAFCASLARQVGYEPER